ncbi:MAG: MotA/TolQ/ExbB proton channel family protein [Burkholderiales bacterium]
METLGFAHFLAQTDALAKTVLALLLAMSIASWYLILTKAFAALWARRRSAKFLKIFWTVGNVDAVARELAHQNPRESYSRLTSRALSARERFGTTRLVETGSMAEFLTRTLRRAIDEETTRMESGLTVLASIGATAPFVGLFGTVWGVYHALVAIGMSGTGTLDKVAGPVGEALIMTGIGLAVAVPAVLGYNAFVRANRVYLARLDTFAHELFAFLVTGEPAASTRSARLTEFKAARG